jgi:hypothetical protein
VDWNKNSVVCSDACRVAWVRERKGKHGGRIELRGVPGVPGAPNMRAQNEDHYISTNCGVFAGMCENQKIREAGDPPSHPHGPAVHVCQPVQFDEGGNPFRKERKFCRACCPHCSEARMGQ